MNFVVNKGKDREKTQKAMDESRKEIVCVTGAGGFLGSWIVNILLQRGYGVRGTVRDVGDAKNAHLKKLEGAKERLELLNADLLDYDSLFSAINGCTGVFHTACPVPSYRMSNPEAEMISPAVKGTLNVLKACSVAKVKRVIMTSSGAAVIMNPNRPMDTLVDESCWSDPEYCEATQNWYFMAKTVSEKNAWNFSKEFGIDLIIICPSMILGPMLQPTINSSSLFIVKFLTGDSDTRDNKIVNIVDVRDSANAHLVAYESPAAAGRYICSAHSITTKELSGILQKLYPQYTYPKNFVDVGSEATSSVRLSNRKLQELGLEFMKLEETLVDTVDCFQKRGVL